MKKLRVERIRLDVLLEQQGLVESRDLAQKVIVAGQVRVAGQLVVEPARLVPEDAEVVVESGPRFVSRGGDKIETALVQFGLDDLSGRICADVGASTGGFTDCLLQHGAVKVYAIDVGYGILHWKLRTDSRVVVMERTNARYVENLPEAVSFVTIDASFISLRIILPVVKGWFDSRGGEVVALIKPQFEAGREEVSRGSGVIHDQAVHREVLEGVLGFAQTSGFAVQGLVRSPIKGPKGNIEFLVQLHLPGGDSRDVGALVAGVLSD